MASSIRPTLLSGPKSATALLQALGISQPTFSRLIRRNAAAENIRTFGRGKGTLYGIPRRVAETGPSFPLFQIDETGECHSLGELTAVENRGFVLEPRSGMPEFYPGIPFFLGDSRPQGYLGRAFAAKNASLGFPNRVQDWSEDQIFAALATRGEYLPGNLLVGNESFRRYQEITVPPPIPVAERATHYEELATRSITGSIPGSSAAGDQPKFPAYLEGEKHVLVKFTPPISTPKGRRWADLLVAEAIASETVRTELDVPVARTEIVEGATRFFLESTRFDRVGACGRRGVISFFALESEWIGSPSVWAASAKRLYQAKRLTKSDADTIQLLDAFGAWIANSDRHYGNLSFYHEFGAPRVALAPLYDMLPMLFAPKESEEDGFPREWSLPMPTPETLPHWTQARDAARKFWERVLADPRISTGFKTEARLYSSAV